ncbi:MAG: NAD(P)-dependent oxidoreductase, partial [Rhodospirillaceae bacterium]
MTKAASGSATPETHQIGFVGLGIMGKSMARHLMAKGYVLNAYTRTMSKIEDLLSEGAVWHDTPAAVAAKSDIVITMVGYPKDVEEVYFGSDGQAGILDAARPGTILVDMTTSAPSLAAKIAEAAAEKGMASIDAPVSGGDVGAKNAALSIMCGGDQAAFEAVLPVFEVMGKAIVLLGPPGAGQHTKMVNQTVICGTLTGVAEGMSYAKAAGLDPAKVLDVIGGGAASSFQLNVLGPKMLAGDYAPGFFAHHFLKDMTISAGEAEEMGL